MRSHVPATESAAKESSPLQRKPALRIGEHDDAYEREADRMADAVTSDSAKTQGISLSKISIAPPVQRDGGAKKKSEGEKYTEALKKVGEAFLETGPGKEIKQKAEQLGDAFISTLPGKIIGGSALAGTIAALAATHSELPVEIPEIPLDIIKPGLKLKLTYEGPVDKPTKVAVTFSIPLGSPRPDPKPAKSKSGQFRAETARMAREQHEFREMLKTPQQRADEQAMINAWVLSRQSSPGDPLLLGIGGGLPPPLAPYATEFKITGEQPKSAAPKKKKKEDTAVQRKSINSTRTGGTPAIVNEVLESSGQPLEPSAREFMESRFGHDFSQVRVHTDERASRSAEAINASAYTAGNRIVFAHGQYSPATQKGRHLLAHELTHVLQQGRQSAARRDSSVLRRKSNTPAKTLTPPQALKATLKGDDDSVRDLTKSPQWAAIKITAEETALLLILLLDGATLNDDEAAGLAVLKKALAQSIFDDGLARLGRKNRFNQLLDDYHGAEYLSLLDLLSTNITQLNVRALYLDAFIAMFWVREHEERAIVVLLERTVPDDRYKLLTVKNRQQALRTAIDTDALTIRYEDVARSVNELLHADLAARLSKLFVAAAKDKAATRNRSQAEINSLLIAAADDLANELAEYQKKLAKALKPSESDADAIAGINKEFELRLKSLLADKQVEFGYELKYGVEFNRFLSNARSRSWTPTDLKEFDKILAQIPPEILRANPRFKKFRRAADHPKKAGSTGYPGTRINLFGSLTLSTTIHELGHVISYDDDRRLQKEFNSKFKWQILSGDDLTRLIPVQKDRDELIEKMDADREKKRKSKRHRHAYGNHYYRYDKKSDEDSYLRHPKNACFISDYAATGRREDFAEAFETYYTDPVKLHKKCPKKFAFMRQRVYTAYIYGKQVASVLVKFEQDFKDQISSLKLKGDLPKELDEKFYKTLRDDLKKALKKTGEELEKTALEIIPTDEMKRVPLTGKEALVAARPYRERVIELFKLLRQTAKPWNAIFSKLVLFKASGPKKYRTTSQIMGAKLQDAFLEDILILIKPDASRIIAGKKAGSAKLDGQLQALVKQCQEAVKVAPAYRADYDHLKTKQFEIEGAIYLSQEEKDRSGPTAWKYLKRVPQTHPGRQDFIDYINERRSKLGEQLGSLRGDMIQQIKAGISYKKSKLTTFNALVKTYEQDLRNYVRKKGLKPKSKKKKAPAVQRKAANGVGSRNDAREKEADRAADYVFSKSVPKPEFSPADPGRVNGITRAGDAVDSTNGVLASSGQALESATRTFMESRLEHDFSRVRIHADAKASVSAQSMNAAAYTSGNHVVFAQGRYQPDTRSGRHLLAHELAHVVQQNAGAAEFGLIQRRGFIDDALIWLGLSEGEFSEDELVEYLDKITKNKKIEDVYDSDNKARAIVGRWRKAESKFNLFPAQKTLLIEEMLSGATLGGDEVAILDLLELSDHIDLRRMFAPGGLNLVLLEKKLDGDSAKRLAAFVASRFKGGRSALLKGKIEITGAAGKAAPRFAYDWPALKARIEGDYTIDEILEIIYRFDSASRDQVLRDIGRERTERQREIDRLGDALAAEKDTAKQDAIKDQVKKLKAARTRLDLILQPIFKDVVASETKAALVAATRLPTASEKTEILKALKPDVKLAKSGKAESFAPKLKGESIEYEQKLRNQMPTMIQKYYDKLVKGRERAVHKDSKKTHDLKKFEEIGTVSIRETDALFGQYKKKDKKGDVLKADTKKKRGNIHDLFADMDYDLRNTMGHKERRRLARRLLFYFFQSNKFVRNLNRQHNASPKFDKKSKPLNDEAKSLHKLAVEFTSTRDQVWKLNWIDRGWPASAGDGHINIQIFKGETVDKDRAFLWDMFQTLIHEYLHTLVHEDYAKYATSFGNTSNTYNTLMEGVDSMLTEIVWSNVESRVNDKNLRTEIEGPEYAELPPITVKHASRRRYASYTEAIKVVNIVGIRNMYVAYFLGKVDRIGG